MFSGKFGMPSPLVIPAVCNENVSPFGDKYICSSVGLSYASFSMALGGFFIWTHTYYLVRTSAIKFREIQAAKDFDSKIPNKDFDANEETSLLKGEKQEQVLLLSDSTIQVDTESQVGFKCSRADFSRTSKVFCVFVPCFWMAAALCVGMGSFSDPPKAAAAFPGSSIMCRNGQLFRPS